MFLVPRIWKEVEVIVKGEKYSIPFSSNGMVGLCPIFETKEQAEEYAAGIGCMERIYTRGNQ